MTYYNALAYTDYGTVVKYHDITDPQKFIDTIRKTLSFTKVFFYRKPRRKDKTGYYCGYIFANQVRVSFTN